MKLISYVYHECICVTPKGVNLWERERWAPGTYGIAHVMVLKPITKILYNV